MVLMAKKGERAGRSTMRVTDPRALKALAHPARQHLLRLLAADSVVTATQAATQVGLSPSAVSHHLRQLEKYGLAERSEPSADAREHPWRATTHKVDLHPAPGDPTAELALRSIIRSELDDLTNRLETHLAWEANNLVHVGLSRTDLNLTDDEVTELQRRLESLVDEYVGRSPSDSQPLSRRHTLLVSLLPTKSLPTS